MTINKPEGLAIDKSKLLQITSLHFCAGLTLENNKVTKAAPILKYMLGWTQAEVQRYCDNKRWVLETT